MGNIYIIITGSYSSSGNLDRFINISRFYSVSKFYSTGVFSCNNGKEK